MDGFLLYSSSTFSFLFFWISDPRWWQSEWMEGHSQWDHMDYIIRFLVFRMKVIYVLNEKNQLKGRLFKKRLDSQVLAIRWQMIIENQIDIKLRAKIIQMELSGLYRILFYLPPQTFRAAQEKVSIRKRKKSVSFCIYIFIFSKEITSPASLYTLVERKGIENDDNIFFAFLLWRKKKEKGMSNLSAYRFIFLNISFLT